MVNLEGNSSNDLVSLFTTEDQSIIRRVSVFLIKAFKRRSEAGDSVETDSFYID